MYCCDVMQSAPTTFVEIIDLWPSPEELASDIGYNAGGVRTWRWRKTIPSSWFAAVSDAAARRGFSGVTLHLMHSLKSPRGNKGPNAAEKSHDQMVTNGDATDSEAA